MRAYLINDDGTLSIASLCRVPGSPGQLTDGNGIINLGDMRVRMTLRGWPDEGAAGVYATDLGARYAIPLMKNGVSIRTDSGQEEKK